MDKLETAIHDAEEAKRIINSRVFAQAFEDVRQKFIAALEAIPTTASGDDLAKDVRRKLAALSYVRESLTSRIDSGKLAEKELTGREKLQRMSGNLIAKLNRSR